jgi:hypothetical protein
VIGVLTFYSSFVGIRVLRRKNFGSEKWYDWLAAVGASLFGAGLLFYGVYIFFLYPQHLILGILSLIFGIFTFLSGFGDIRFFMGDHPADKKWWLGQHIGAIGGSYIAAITAFAVQSGGALMTDSSLNWLLWVLPAVVGTPLLSRLKRKHLSLQ